MSEEISRDRRRYLGAAVKGLPAAELVMIGAAHAQSGTAPKRWSTSTATNRTPLIMSTNPLLLTAVLACAVAAPIETLAQGGSTNAE